MGVVHQWSPLFFRATTACVFPWETSRGSSANTDSTADDLVEQVRKQNLGVVELLYRRITSTLWKTNSLLLRMAT